MKQSIIAGLIIATLSGCMTLDKKATMDKHEKIDYVEFPATDMDATKAFFGKVFGWSFTDYGPEYMDCPDGGIMTGFFPKTEAHSSHSTAVILRKLLRRSNRRVERSLNPSFHFPAVVGFNSPSLVAMNLRFGLTSNKQEDDRLTEPIV